jgi:hypothetical protein
MTEARRQNCALSVWMHSRNLSAFHLVNIILICYCRSQIFEFWNIYHLHLQFDFVLHSGETPRYPQNILTLEFLALCQICTIGFRGLCIVVSINNIQMLDEVPRFLVSVVSQNWHIVMLYNIKLQYPVTLRTSDFAFRFFAVNVQRRLILSHRLLFIATCFGLIGHHQMYRLLWWRTD